MTMASPSPRELEEELMAAGSEPGNLWVPDAGWRGGWVEVGWACAALLFCFGGGRWEAHEVRGCPLDGSQLLLTPISPLPQELVKIMEPCR